MARDLLMPGGGVSPCARPGRGSVFPPSLFPVPSVPADSMIVSQTDNPNHNHQTNKTKGDPPK